MSGPVRLECRGAVGWLTLDRPPLNVLNLAMLDQLLAMLDQAAAQPGLKVLVLQGAGRGFCAGVDVADHTADRAPGMLERFHAVIHRVMGLEMVTVAAVHGAALGGGCELALACDLVLATEEAKLGQPEIQLAVFPPVAAVLLPRRIGRQAAFDLILTGRVVSGLEARQAGLVQQAWPAERFEAELGGYLARLTPLSGPALRLTKRVINQVQDLPFGAALARAEAIYLNDLMRLKDPHEGLAAFLEKRSPVWTEA